jgi:transglutaminase-like putative cysteine protease
VFPARTRTISPIERFFQFSLLGLVASGYFALAASGALDRPTLILTCAALLARGAWVAGLLDIEIPAQVASLLALTYVAFFPFDLYLLSRDFLTATVHAVCFLASIKVLTARNNRDYLYTGAISFIELVAAALLSAKPTFFLWLGIYVICAIAAFMSAEIRRGLDRHQQTVSSTKGRVAWRLAGVAFAAGAGILVLTAGLFLIVPRTARVAAMLLPGTPRLTGFSNVVDLGGFGKISRDDRAVLHILSYSRALPSGLRWRGGALSRFDGKKWDEPPRAGTFLPVTRGSAVVADAYQLSRRDGRRLLYRVEVQNSELGTLFVAGIPEFVNVDAPRLLLTPEDSLRVLAPPRETLRYEVSAHSGPPLAWPLTYAERRRYLALPPIDVRIWSLAREWAGEGSPLEQSLRIQQRLQKDFKYTLDGPEKPAKDPLADFLFVRKEGYCEYFASAMAVMLRALNIPSRVATGFQSGYYNDVSGLYVVRASDAHAWVEGWIEGRGWTTFDPTPVGAGSNNAGIFSRINMYLDAADHAWQEWVVSYNIDQQVAIAARFEGALRELNGAGSRPGASWLTDTVTWTKAWGVPIIVGILLAIAGIFFGPGLWQALRRRTHVRRIQRSGGSARDASLLYEAMLNRLAKRGFEKPGWFTPNEFAAHLPAEEKRRVMEFTRVYNAIRFGGDAAATTHLASMLQEFE